MQRVKRSELFFTNSESELRERRFKPLGGSRKLIVWALSRKYHLTNIGKILMNINTILYYSSNSVIVNLYFVGIFFLMFYNFI